MEKRTVGGGDVYLMEEGTISQGHTPDGKEDCGWRGCLPNGRGDNKIRTHIPDGRGDSGWRRCLPDGRGDNITRTHT